MQLSWPSLCFALLLPVVTSARAEDRRPYTDGQLTKHDFRGKPDEGKGARAANTVTEVRHEYRYKYRSDGQHVLVTLDTLHVHAYVRRDLSWNKQPEEKWLLDHEQGHADIAQIQALRARIKLHRLTQPGTHLETRAATLKEAVAGLEKELHKHMEEFTSTAADAEYDEATLHGLGPKQAELRRVQHETLKKLEGELAHLQRAKPK